LVIALPSHAATAAAAAADHCSLHASGQCWVTIIDCAIPAPPFMLLLLLLRFCSVRASGQRWVPTKLTLVLLCFFFSSHAAAAVSLQPARIWSALGAHH
jgi:hypothetical protein